MANRTNAEYTEQDRTQQSDHDSLLRLEGKLDQLITNVQTLKEATEKRIAELKDGITDKITVLQKDVSDLKFGRTGLVATYGVFMGILIFLYSQWISPFINEISKHLQRK